MEQVDKGKLIERTIKAEYIKRKMPLKVLY